MCRASVPIEHILQLAVDLKSHLLATCMSLVMEEGGGRKKKKSAKNSRAGAQNKQATGMCTACTHVSTRF